MTRIQEVFAANVRFYRKRAGLSQEELAERSGLHRTYIGGIEQRRINASPKNIEKIASALDVDPAFLFAKEISSPLDAPFRITRIDSPSNPPKRATMSPEP